MSRITVLYLKGDDYERRMVREAYARLEHDGTAKRVFCDGTVRNAAAFEADLFRAGSLPFIVFSDASPCAVTWLNSIEGRSVRGHFAVFKPFWGREKTVVIGQSIFEYYLGLNDVYGYLFDVVIGLVPVSNPLGWKLALLCGAERKCVLPHAIYNAFTGRTEDAVLTVTTRETLVTRNKKASVPFGNRGSQFSIYEDDKKAKNATAV